jgi:hypothetical protein
MIEKFERRGKWWLPAQEDDRIDGTLTYSPADGAILELAGAFGALPGLLASGSFPAPRIILGTTASGEYITLLNCAQKRWHTAGTYLTSSYRVEVVFVGAHFQSHDEIEFESLYVHYSHLDSWAGFHYFEHTREEGATMVSYRNPRPIVAYVGDGLAVSVDPAVSEQGEGSPPRRVILEADSRVRIRRGEPTHLDRFLRPMRLTQVFLSLGVGAAVHPVAVTGVHLEMPDDAAIPRCVGIHWQPAVAVAAQRALFPSEMMFTLPDISDRFERFLRNWFQTAELLGPVVDLYLAALAETGIYAEHRFLTLCQALESLHRRRHGGHYLSRDEYGPAYVQLIHAIPDWIAPDHRTALEARLKYGHEYSLRKRLTDIFSAHDPVLREVFLDPPSFINKVVKTRNYFTHYDEEDEQDAATGGLELHRLASNLRTLIEVCLLSEIGFTSEELRKQLKEISSRRVIEPILYE